MAKLYDLEAAKEVAQEVAEWLRPACTRLEIVGSIRRERPRVHDVDLLVFPKFVEGGQGELFGGSKKVSALDELLPRLSFQERLHVARGGNKYKQLFHARTGTPVDLYLVGDMTAWWILTVIRTGSAQFNKRLCTRALELGMQLHADGSGIERCGKPVRVGSELSIFRSLSLPWVPPKEREC